MLASFSISKRARRSRTRSRMSLVTSRKSFRPGPLPKRKQAQLDLEAGAVNVPALGLDVQNLLSGSDLAQERFELRLPFRRDRGDRLPDDFRFAEPVEALRRGVPFDDLERAVVEGNGAGRRLQKTPVMFPRAAQLLLAPAPLPHHVPGRPRGEQQRRRHAPRDVEVMERGVIHLAEQTGFQEFPDGEHESDDAGARERQRRPEPPRLRRSGIAPTRRRLPAARRQAVGSDPHGSTRPLVRNFCTPERSKSNAFESAAREFDSVRVMTNVRPRVHPLLCCERRTLKTDSLRAEASLGVVAPRVRDSVLPGDGRDVRRLGKLSAPCTPLRASRSR